MGDFMLSSGGEKPKVWLIEVNSSPAMDYSTHVTTPLVKKVLEDTAKVLVDRRIDPSADIGEWELLRHDGQRHKIPQPIIREKLQVVGTAIQAKRAPKGAKKRKKKKKSKDQKAVSHARGEETSIPKHGIDELVLTEKDDEDDDDEHKSEANTESGGDSEAGLILESEAELEGTDNDDDEAASCDDAGEDDERLDDVDKD